MHASGDRTRAINFKDGGKDHEIRDRPAFSPRHESAMRHFPTPPAAPAGIYRGRNLFPDFRPTLSPLHLPIPANRKEIRCSIVDIVKFVGSD